LMMHICPIFEENKIFENIRKFIDLNLAKMDSKHLQAVMIGSKKDYKPSRDLFKNIRNYLEEQKIPTSIFRGGRDWCGAAYSAETDEWFISNKTIQKELSNTNDKQEVLKKAFDEVVISNKDEVICINN